MSHRANILIVDDERVVRLSHLRSLAAADYDAAAVGSGSEALHVMERESFDVVFLDIRMPDIDGIAVLKTIKQRWPDSEVIMITGYPTIDSAKEAVRLGAYHYLVKPVSPDDVVKAANDALLHKNWALRLVRAKQDGTDPADRSRWANGRPPQLARQGGAS
jgi:two-component system response regulator HydG